MEKRKFYFGQMNDAKWEEIRKFARNYDFGIIFDRQWTVTKICTTNTIPIVHGQARFPYLGFREDWRTQKVFQELKKSLKRGSCSPFEDIYGNEIPDIVWAHRIINNPVKLVKELGCYRCQVRGEISKSKKGPLAKEAKWEISRNIWGDHKFRQLGNLLLKNKFPHQKWEVLLVMPTYDKYALAEAIKISSQ